ncbi:hypothetical protein [Erythrobacter sp. HKB08]|uniref:hypothetical protein n=1 Tax=Erythrobacter sp. HKB08 TaxID=2502843 RepID=UPI0010090320|nr:hypothetical protein [Erythrobacter sp. HKB08]
MEQEGGHPQHAPRILQLGVTGHREGNAAFDANASAIEQAIDNLLAALHERLGGNGPDAPTFRLMTNLAHGTDMMSAERALALGWKLLAPLPFGRQINLALNTPGLSPEEVHRVAAGAEPEDEVARREYHRLKALGDRAACFELADQDALVLEGLAKLPHVAPGSRAAQDVMLLISDRSRAASTVTVEMSDVLVAVWDGSSPSALGGTRDTINQALVAEVPVVWIDARNPSSMQMLADPADLVAALETPADSGQDLIVEAIAQSTEEAWAAMADASDHLEHGAWRPFSARRFHAYRRIEALFGGDGRPFRSLVQRYEDPRNIESGSLGPMLVELENLPGADKAFVHEVGRDVIPHFALADGIATYLSDAYRGGMVASFILSAAAIVGGVAYLPLVGAEWKWPFALLEFLLLILIVLITIAGTRGNWHRRWFGTRRVAEYLRHAPMMLSLGCTRPIGRWPKSRDAQWPELDARARTMAPGIPEMKLTHAYLREHAKKVLRPYLVGQRDYHRGKVERLEKVHHNLDRVSEVLFVLAIISVGGFLLMELFAALGVIPKSVPYAFSKPLTFLGVAFPTLGAAFAGIRYFGDFERFAAISDVSATKLDRLRRRVDLLIDGNERDTSYGDFVDLAHAMSDVVVEEIESWQSIFGTKKMAVPV